MPIAEVEINLPQIKNKYILKEEAIIIYQNKNAPQAAHLINEI